MELMKVPVGQVVYKQGELKASSMYIVLDGAVQVRADIIGHARINM